MVREMTFGAELELADIDTRLGLPPGGFGWDEKDFSMVNSNGIAVDPLRRLYPYGGEVLTPPATTVSDLVEKFQVVMEHFAAGPPPVVNYRSNLHVHVRIPRLAEDLGSLIDFQSYIHEVLPPVLPTLVPIPEPPPGAPPGARQRFRRRHRSHRTFLTPARLEHQLNAPTVEEFFRREVPATKAEGRPMWHAQARVAVNLRQLLQTDTVEFRHFPGTTCVEEFRAAVEWCRNFTLAWLEDVRDLRTLAREVSPRLPRFCPYDDFLEQRYLLTTHDGTLRKAEIAFNINEITSNE